MFSPVKNISASVKLSNQIIVWRFLLQLLKCKMGQDCKWADKKFKFLQTLFKSVLCPNKCPRKKINFLYRYIYLYVCTYVLKFCICSTLKTNNKNFDLNILI